MPTPLLKTLALTAALALPCAASAATVYDESIDGDAGDGVFSTAPHVLLGLGPNVILGSVTSNFVAPPDFDAFVLVVGPGQRIVSMLYSATQRSSGERIMVGIGWVLKSGGTFLSYEYLGVPVDPAPFFSSVTPLGSGIYLLQSDALVSQGSFEASATADYRIEVNVAPVPLPAGAAMLAGSLGLLALLRRRRRG